MKKNKTDRHCRIRQAMAGLALVLMVVAICIPADANAAERKFRGEWILPEHYPAQFDGYGYINRIAAEEVVIDEKLLRLSPAVTYTTLTSVMAGSKDFADGDLVSFLTNTDQEIISLWLIEKGRP